MGKSNRKMNRTRENCCVAGRLSQARSGTRVQIADLDADNHETLQKMILMGALPGKAVEIIQRFPAFLIGLGNSQFAIDRELADKIIIKPLYSSSEQG